MPRSFEAAFLTKLIVLRDLYCVGVSRRVVLTLTKFERENREYGRGDGYVVDEFFLAYLYHSSKSTSIIQVSSILTVDFHPKQ